ncbi:MAG: hypothetical protein ACRDGS_14720, partial [Chloroflexota bacterium]
VLELAIVDGGSLDPSPLPVQRWNPQDHASPNALPRPIRHDPLDLSPLRDLPPDSLFGLNISGTTLLPHGLAPLQGLTGLRLLFLFQMEIGDGDVAYLAACRREAAPAHGRCWYSGRHESNI